MSEPFDMTAEKVSPPRCDAAGWRMASPPGFESETSAPQARDRMDPVAMRLRLLPTVAEDAGDDAGADALTAAL